MHMYNSEKPKEQRTFDEQWHENSRVWKDFVTDAVFIVRGKGEILDILKEFKAMLKDDPVARGDPRRLSWHLIVYSCCNESKFGRDDNWKECAAYLLEMPEGCDTIFGPADGMTWW